MSLLDELINEQKKKLALLRDEGINPYPSEININIVSSAAIDSFEELSKTQKRIVMGGRVMALREQGAIIFFTFRDGDGNFQGMLRQDEIGKDALKFFLDIVGIGDFIEIDGTLVKTKRGEKTISVNQWRMLAKSLRPLPDKWHGLKDVEERFRRRYLDILMSDETRVRFKKRALILSSLRRFFEDNDFIEVETPVLQHLAGGALARPFETNYNALDIKMFLRIAPELYLKELLVGGMTKVFEIGRNFRNEGIDVTHNPEFTMLEWYEAYSDAKKQCVFVEELIRFISKKIHKEGIFSYNKEEIDVNKKFEIISFYAAFEQYAGIKTPAILNRDEYAREAVRLNIEVSNTENREKIMDAIYKKVIKPKIIQPTFIIDYPVEFSPFAKRQENNPDLIDRFQLVIGGLEIVNAFSELNDPEEQRARYLEQDKKKKDGDIEIAPFDESYIEAMEYGMPPAGGVGLGVDRLVMFLTDAHNIREVILFPTLREKE